LPSRRSWHSSSPSSSSPHSSSSSDPCCSTTEDPSHHDLLRWACGSAPAGSGRMMAAAQSLSPVFGSQRSLTLQASVPAHRPVCGAGCLHRAGSSTDSSSESSDNESADMPVQKQRPGRSGQAPRQQPRGPHSPGIMQPSVSAQLSRRFDSRTQWWGCSGFFCEAQNTALQSALHMAELAALRRSRQAGSRQS
jgi:hypothetical protein